MSDTEQELLRLLTQRSFQRGNFTLASGATSDYYIDGRTSAVFSRSARLIGSGVAPNMPVFELHPRVSLPAQARAGR